jgi:hypothetical protein
LFLNPVFCFWTQYYVSEPNILFLNPVFCLVKWRLECWCKERCKIRVSIVNFKHLPIVRRTGRLEGYIFMTGNWGGGVTGVVYNNNKNNIY